MTSARGLAVYRVSPRLLVAETEDGRVLERSLPELQAGGSRVSDRAGNERLEGLQVLTGR